MRSPTMTMRRPLSRATRSRIVRDGNITRAGAPAPSRPRRGDPRRRDRAWSPAAPLAPRAVGDLVAHHDRAREVEAEIVRGAPEESGTRLAAVTIHAIGLRALVRV